MADKLPMTRVTTGAYELTIGPYKFELLSDKSPVMGAQGRPVGHTEWLGYVNGDVVSSSDNATTVKQALAPLVEMARAVETVERTKDQGRALLATLYDGLDNVPKAVMGKIDAYGRDAQVALDNAMPTASVIEAAPEKPKAITTADPDEQKKARAWAAENGVELSARGQVPKDVVKAYRADDLDMVDVKRRPSARTPLAEVETVPPPPAESEPADA